MTFQEIKTPQQLMAYLDENFEYGVIDSSGNKYFDSDTKEFQDACNIQWRTRPVKQILRDKIGHCYDQVEVEREWFVKNGYEIKTFWISAYQEGVENSGFSHSYLLYKTNDGWNLFEHADKSNRGIHKFKNVDDAVKWQASKQVKFADSHTKPADKYTTCIKQYEKPAVGLNMQEFISFINNSMDY